MELDHPEHPYEAIEHEVTIGAHAIRRYCTPVSFSREDAADVAEMLGVSRGMLHAARRRGRFEERLIKGLGGKRGSLVPLLSPNGELLDPGHQDFARPHPVWGSMWEWLAREMPRDFEQAVVRRPVFKRMDGKKLPAPSVHSHALTPALSRREREQFAYKDEMQFMGWKWVCPMCRKEVRTIYYPMAVRTLFDSWFIDPVIQLKLCDADLPETPPPMFGCVDCHRIKFFSSIDHDSWNSVISYLSGGMLYGSEVARPASFVGRRKRTRIRQLNREAPKRRKVLTRLRLGWSNFQIARDLGLRKKAVVMHVVKICREEGVADRYALAKKLNFRPPPLNYLDRAKARREAVKEMMLRDCAQREIMEKLGIDKDVLKRTVKAIYKLHGINGKGGGAGRRRKLAEKMGRTFVARMEKEMREDGGVAAGVPRGGAANDEIRRVNDERMRKTE